MSNIPPPLKWLVEKRARVAGALLKAETRATQLAAIKVKAAAKAREGASAAASLRLDLESLDRTMGLHSSKLSGASIAPIFGWVGRYGRRGALRERLASHLKEQFPAWVPTGALAADALDELGICFETPAERKQWMRNSLLSALKAMTKVGEAERAPAGHLHRAQAGWRWVSPAPTQPQTLADLHAGADRGGTP